MAHYIFNSAPGEAAELLALGMWGVGADEPHRDALVAGDRVLVYVAAPDREFIGRAELGSAVHAWTPEEARVYPGRSEGGVLLAQVEEWETPVPMDVVLARLNSAKAKADFDAGVVQIVELEYETVMAVAAERSG